MQNKDIRLAPGAIDRYSEIRGALLALNKSGAGLQDRLLSRGAHRDMNDLKTILACAQQASSSLEAFIGRLPRELRHRFRGHRNPSMIGILREDHRDAISRATLAEKERMVAGAKALSGKLIAIKTAVAWHFGLEVNQLVCGCQEPRFARPRHIAAYLARESGASLLQIGQLLLRHHTTVIHSVKAGRKLAEANPDAIEQIRQLIVRLSQEGKVA